MGTVTPIRRGSLPPDMLPAATAGLPMLSLSRDGDNVWRSLIDLWRDYMVTAGMPASTVTLRLYHVTRAARELGGDPAAVTLMQLVAWLGSKQWQPNTRRSYRSSLRAFYRWAVDTGQLETNPAAGLPPVRVPRGVPRPAPDAAYRAALAAPDPRVRLASRMAGQLGMRRGEIARSTREHVEPCGGAGGWGLRVEGKGGHVRIVPLPADLALELLARPAGWLFPSTHGGHLTPHHLGKLVAAALPGDLTTHTLRHRAGTVAYETTHDLRAVQELLGHAKPETTALYTKVPDAAIRRAMEGAA